jgi:hypothetical protein
MSEIDDTFNAVQGLGEAKIVDHMGFGRVVRVEGDGEALRDKMDRLPVVKYVADNVEGKVELGLFEKYERPELTESLRDIIRKARGEQG